MDELKALCQAYLNENVETFEFRQRLVGILADHDLDAEVAVVLVGAIR